jgi:hypothetical protein
MFIYPREAGLKRNGTDNEALNKFKPCCANILNNLYLCLIIEFNWGVKYIRPPGSPGGLCFEKSLREITEKEARHGPA